jgi:HK97 family phage major capsid protein
MTTSPFVDLEQARRSVALELSRYYRELSGNEPEEPRRFSFSRVISAMTNPRGLVDGYEAEVCGAAATLAGRRHDPNRVIIPLSAFKRDLLTSSASAGGYLVSSRKMRPADVLRSWSVAARAGITVLDGLVGNPSIPRVIAAAQASWQSTETTQITQSEPTFGEAVAKPKQVSIYAKFSRQASLQVDSLDSLIELQMLEAVGAAKDQAVIAGTGANGQPTGIINTVGIGTQAGASLSHAGTRTMRKQVLDAGAVEDRLAWVGAPDVQDVLSGRERFSGGGRAIWDDGNILGKQAAATKHAPNGTLIAGDWANCILCLWGTGVMVEIDPYTNFNTAKIGARIILECDVVIAQPTSFSVATSVS